MMRKMMSLKYLHKLIKMPELELAKEIKSIEPQDFRQIIKLALKEQDRETRQLCASACMNAYSNQFNKTPL